MGFVRLRGVRVLSGCLFLLGPYPRYRYDAADQDRQQIVSAISSKRDRYLRRL